MQTKSWGFSLLEILIALFIFSILGLILNKGLHTVIQAQEGSMASAKELSEIESALLLFSQELAETVDRPILRPDGREEEPFWGNATSLRFTHLGIIQAEAPLSSPPLEQSRYRFQQSEWLREADNAFSKTTAVHSRLLVSALKTLQFRYLDQHHHYHDHWPLGSGNEKLPQAVELQLELRKGGKLEMTYPLSQREVPHASL